MRDFLERFRRELGVVRDMPPVPQALARVMTVLGRRDVPLLELASAVSEEPVLTARVLRIANSAAYAPRHEILSVHEALLRIGLASARRLMLALGLRGFVPRAEFFVHQRSFWQHSLGVAHTSAVVVRRAAVSICGLEEDEAYTLGLLHDIGLIGLAGYFPAEFAAVRALARRSALPYYAAETPVLGTDHGELGAVIARSWGLPRTVVEVIRTHHRLDQVPPDLRHAVEALSVAEWLAREARIADLDEGWKPQVDASTLESLGLPADPSELIWEARGESERTQDILACAA